MDDYYSPPWYYHQKTLPDGSQELSIYSSKEDLIANVYRQTAEASEDDWRAIGVLMAISPEPLAIARAVANDRVDENVKGFARSLLNDLDKYLKKNEGFDFYKQVDSSIENSTNTEKS